MQGPERGITFPRLHGSPLAERDEMLRGLRKRTYKWAKCWSSQTRASRNKKCSNQLIFVCGSAVPSHQLLKTFRRSSAWRRTPPPTFIPSASNLISVSESFVLSRSKIEYPFLFIVKGHFLRKCLVRIRILFPQQSPPPPPTQATLLTPSLWNMSQRLSVLKR